MISTARSGSIFALAILAAGATAAWSQPAVGASDFVCINGTNATFVLGTLNKSAEPVVVAPGQDVLYTVDGLFVSNVEPVGGVLTQDFDDPLPPETLFRSLDSVAWDTCSTPLVGSGGTIHCGPDMGPMTGNPFAFTVRIAPATPPGSVVNTASVRFMYNGSLINSSSEALLLQGPFNCTGDPSVTIRVVAAPGGIPALSTVGLLMLAGLLSIAGLFVLFRARG